MIEHNKQGGIQDLITGALQRAKSVDLITFPKTLRGTNCFNCIWIKDKKNNIGYCFNEKVKQHVNAQMCCNLWGREGTIRAWEQK